MKDNNKKKIILIIGIVLVLGIIIFVILNRNNLFKNGIILDNNNKPVVKDIEINNNINELTVLSSRIEKTGKVSSIFVKVKNNTDQVISE